MSAVHGTLAPFSIAKQFDAMREHPLATQGSRFARSAILLAIVGAHALAFMAMTPAHRQAVTTVVVPMYATLTQETASLPAPSSITPAQARPEPKRFVAKPVMHRNAPVPTHVPTAQPVPMPVATAPTPIQHDNAPTSSLPSTEASSAPAVAVTRVAAPVASALAIPKTVTQGVQYLRPPVLVYPDTSRRMGEEGVASVRVLVDADGMPKQVELHGSSGSPALDQAALQAVRDARFKPYVENGSAIPVYVIVPLRFSLGN